MIRAVVLASGLAFTGIATSADVLHGRVVGVSDGDTLTIYDGKAQQRIRLAEIDAPEKRQAFGNVAKERLSALCFDTQAKVRVVDVDRYGRTVGRVTCRGRDANPARVRDGVTRVDQRT